LRRKGFLLAVRIKSSRQTFALEQDCSERNPTVRTGL
jgi:hypothetical protein